MKNRIDDLRDHLFETLEMLKDGDMDIDRAKAIGEVAGKLIDSAKVEVQYLSVTGQARGSRFLQAPDSPHGGPRLVGGTDRNG